MAKVLDWRVLEPADYIESKDKIIQHLTTASQHSSKIKLNTDSSFSEIEQEARRLALTGQIDERDDDFILMMMLAAAGGVEAVAYFPIQVLDELRGKSFRPESCDIEDLMASWDCHLRGRAMGSSCDQARHQKTLGSGNEAELLTELENGAPISASSVSGTAQILVTQASDVKVRLSSTYQALKHPLPFGGAKRPLDVGEQLLAEFPQMADQLQYLMSSLSLMAVSGQSCLTMDPILVTGRAGVGKTYFAKMLATLLQLPFHVHSVGGNSDNRSLKGTSMGWSTAEPCLPVRVIAQQKCPNPVIIIDEVEKASRGSMNGDVQETLLGFLEKETSEAYFDEGLGCTVNLSFVNWILTSNSSDKLTPQVRSRCQILNWQPPRPENVETLLWALQRKIAADAGLPLALIEPFPADTIAMLRGFYKNRGSIRCLRHVVGKLMLRDLTHPGRQLH